MRHEITIRVNGSEETLQVEARRTLLEVLRDDLDLTGAKEGCNEGECGSCMVLVDGRTVNSCMMLAVEADGCEVTTIEGIGRHDDLHPVQQAFIDHAAIQCGFCTPGMVITAVALLAENPAPSEEEIRRALSGNLCRCTGYRQIVDAIHQAARQMAASEGTGERRTA